MGTSHIAAFLVLEQNRAIWAKLWDEGSKGVNIDAKSEHIPLPSAFCPMALALAAGTLKKCTSCIDGMHPRRLTGVSDNAISALCKMVRVVEAAATWPKGEREVITALIPKADGGAQASCLVQDLLSSICQV